MQTIDRKWLEKTGVDFTDLPDEDAGTLINKTLAELELRVGNVLASKFTDEQIREFEKLLEDNGDTLGWLEKNYTDYPLVVRDESEALADEIHASKDKINLIMSWDYPLPE
ncbi:MAG: DUF5663 domain-containing protein [Candidatus Saccharimonadales bacterium]|jgi:hypothetical protein